MPAGNPEGYTDKARKAGDKEKKRLMKATPEPEIRSVKKPDRTLPEKVDVEHTHRGKKAELLAQPIPLDPDERDKLRRAYEMAGIEWPLDDLPLKRKGRREMPSPDEFAKAAKQHAGSAVGPDPDKVAMAKRKEELRKMWFAKYMPKTGK